MADLAVDRAVRDSGMIAVHGAGFTKTTTQVTCDGEMIAFNWVSEAEITFDDPGSGSAVTVTKGDASFTVPIEDAANGEPDQPADAPPVPPDAPPPEDQFNMPAQNTTNSTDDYSPRTSEEKAELLMVEPVTPVGVAPDQPYPEGGRDPEDDFAAAHGFRRDGKPVNNPNRTTDNPTADVPEERPVAVQQGDEQKYQGVSPQPQEPTADAVPDRQPA